MGNLFTRETFAEERDGDAVTSFVGVEVYEPYLNRFIENGHRLPELGLLNSAVSGDSDRKWFVYAKNTMDRYHLPEDRASVIFWRDSLLDLKPFERLSEITKMTSITPRCYSTNRSIISAKVSGQ